MMNTRSLTFAAAAGLLTAVTATAQCSDNTYPVRLVDAAGNELAKVFDGTLNEDVFLSNVEEVYLAFDANLPSGTYYVHVTDTPINGMDEVVSKNDPMDRFVQVDNTGGVISLSLPFSTNPSAVTFGVGLNGAGQSLQLNPFDPSQYSQCRLKVWYGDAWDLSNGPTHPWLLAGGLHPQTGQCAVRSYQSFRVGDGTGSDVCGMVFGDDDRSGALDGSEQGLDGVEVRLTGPNGTLSTTTQPDGSYCFLDVGKDTFTIEAVTPNGKVATTSLSNELVVCNCATVTAPDFGFDEQVLACEAKSLRYYVRRRGACEAVQAGILPTLPALAIVNSCGRRVAPCTKYQFRCFLYWSRCWAWNMAFSLSGELVTMHANVLTGRVDPQCVICDPCLGVMTIEQLLQQSVASLCDHPYTPPCSGSARHDQRKLRNALRRANKNRIWQ
ncbi:MAG: SdrD B-like domain-containing protein [Planctomycetota bacterium]